MTNIENTIGGLVLSCGNVYNENGTDISVEVGKYIESLLQKERERIAEEVEKLGDIWKLEATAENTESSCPKFIRINRGVLSIIKQGK